MQSKASLNPLAYFTQRILLELIIFRHKLVTPIYLHRVRSQTGLLGSWASLSSTARGVGTTGMASQMSHVRKNWPD